MASTSDCSKSLPHSPPNCQVPTPTTLTRRSVLPRVRYFMQKRTAPGRARLLPSRSARTDSPCAEGSAAASPSHDVESGRGALAGDFGNCGFGPRDRLEADDLAGAVEG